MGKNRSLLDLEVIEKKLSEFDEYVLYLENIQNTLHLESFLEDTQQQWSVEHGLQLCIQMVIDLGSHILVSLNLNNIQDYSDVGKKLGKHGILEAELSKRTVDMIKFRNLLVHEYVNVDPQRVFEILKIGISDFKEISQQIKSFILKL